MILNSLLLFDFIGRVKLKSSLRSFLRMEKKFEINFSFLFV